MGSVRLACLAFVCGCSFDVAALRGAPVRGDGGPDAAADEGARDGGETAADGPADGPGSDVPLPPPFCDQQDPDLVACYRFENDVADGSGYWNDGTATDVTYGPGVTGFAVRTTTSSDIVVPERASLDVTGAITMELWVRAASFPTGTARAGLLDNDAQYSLFLYPGGEVRCGTGGPWLVSPAALVLHEWAHLGCVFDGAEVRLYLNGALIASQAQTEPLSTIGTTGLRIGHNNPSDDPFDGALDGLRIWRVARSASELCTLPGACG
jgi:hypothetical protein